MKAFSSLKFGVKRKEQANINQASRRLRLHIACLHF
jgi:hypothetical protein